MVSKWAVGRTRGQLSRLAAGLALLVLLSGLLTVATWSAARADTCAPNPVACENAKPGNPESEWDIEGSGDDSIQGYATDVSVNIGHSISFKIDTDARAYSIDIYRLGWYQGNGARKIDSISPSVVLPQHQDPCLTDPETEIYDCGRWAVSATWTVPSTAVSGVYIAKLTRPDTGASSHIVFVVRDDSSTSKILFKTSDNTWQAYNTYGGSDFYQGVVNGRAYKVSLNRPYETRGANDGRDFLFSNEYPMIRFLERNGYDLSYTTDLDTDRYGSLLTRHQVFMSTGHDEYWSGPERDNVEAARDAGVNLAFFSGNEVYWRTRWEPSEDGNNTADRTLVCYKETWDNAKTDPTPEWTGTWRDPRFSPPSNGGRPENSLTGTQYMSNSDDLALQVPAAEGKDRLWRYTSVANLAPGTTATLAPHTIGYESDEDVDNGFRPGGLIWLSTTTGSTPQYLRDFGLTVTPGTTTHHLTLYRAASGALVFSAGTIQWAWGLDSDHDGSNPAAADVRMQQATVNLLADMGVQPTSLMSTLTASPASTDAQPPTVTITSPAGGTSVANGALVTMQGTATDAGGGVVAGVEVSTDGGMSWHAATGTTSWSYPVYVTGAATMTVLVRAIDDSANIQPTPTSLQLTVTGSSSLFGTRVPGTPAINDTSAVSLGVKFKAQDDGFVTGIRFYKGTGNLGTHTGSLWTAGGTLLATGTFGNETTTGWQTLNFGTPVAISAGTTYVASYYAPKGHYAGDSYAFSYNGFSAPPLSATRSLGEDGNGVFGYGDAFPDQSFNDTNYYVDVLFTDSAATGPAVLSTSPVANALNVAVNAHPSATFSKTLNPNSIQFTLTDGSGAAVPGSVAYDPSSKTVTFAPSASLGINQTYTASVQATDTNGIPSTGPGTWSFTTDKYATVDTLFDVDATPVTSAADDSSAVELGVKFTPSVNGQIIGVRFYQGTGNTGTHTGTLWSASGTQLQKATFSGETGSGWQSVRFTSPVNVTAGTTYVASYYAPNGHYAVNSNFFTSTFTNSPLSAPADSNGLFKYGSDAFPTSSYQSSNYWVDPLFVPGSGTGTSPSPSPSPNPSPSPSASPSPSPSQSPNVTGPSVTIFTDSDTPASANWPDASAIEVGVRFTSDVAGQVTGVRFYKGPQNTGTHTGSLWTSTGQLLATATFSSETASGWQTVTFNSPVTITPGTTYVASYSSTVGYYAVTVNQFNGVGLDRPPLHVLASGGAYHYGAGFPDSSAPHNYWVDVVFHPSS